MNHVLETDRLILRPFTLDDIEPSYQMNLDEQVSKYTVDGGVVSKEEVERRVTNVIMGDYQKYGYGRFAVELKVVSSFIGFAGLKFLEDRNEVDLGYRLMSKYWGNGYATEASIACVDFGFNTIGLEKIIALVLPDNKGSINVLEKLNFEYEKDVMEDDLLARLYSLKSTV